jgi:hypothetical protein
MAVTEEGIVREPVKRRQYAKIKGLMIVREEGITREPVKPEQLENA